jgi:hypothetical protein
MIKPIWILGHGKILVHSQFLVDYKRLCLWFNNRKMPLDVRDGTRLLYEETGDSYYAFTKYLNQTVGNLCFETLYKLTSDAHLTVLPCTMVIKGFSSPPIITCAFQCQGLNRALVRKRLYRVSMTINLQSYAVAFECSI